MMKLAAITIVLSFTGTAPRAALAAQTNDLTACRIVTAAEAQKLVGGPLEVKEHAKIPTANGPGTYDSICPYTTKGVKSEDLTTMPRVLDLTLHFLHSADAAKQLYEEPIEQYRQMAKAPDAPFKNATITPIEGFGDKAFALEAAADAKTSCKSALIVFIKGKVGGTVGAWNKPGSSLETSKLVLKHILGKLP